MDRISNPFLPEVPRYRSGGILSQVSIVVPNIETLISLYSLYKPYVSLDSLHKIVYLIQGI